MNKRQAKKLIKHSSRQMVWLDDECTQLGAVWRTFPWKMFKFKVKQGNTRRRIKKKWHIPSKTEKMLRDFRNRPRRYGT